MTGLLEIRMEALRANLTRLAEESEWKSHLGIAYENVDNDLWQAAFDNIYRRTRNALKKLDDIRAGRATKIWPDEKAWIKYREVYLISQALFQECLELQGGLAMRDRKLDREICQMADELIKECARVMVQKSALAIPAQAAALSTTLSRIARVRFPEWDVWTLPLVAHEYGHFAIGDYDELKEFVGDTGQDWQALAVPGESDVERRVRTLVADGFATYTTGPAYVCALVLLRLSPFDADLRSRPENCQRARMVFATVKKMDKDGLYESLMRKLHEYWDDSLAAVQGAGSRTTLDDLDLDAGLLISTRSTGCATY